MTESETSELPKPLGTKVWAFLRLMADAMEKRQTDDNEIRRLVLLTRDSMNDLIRRDNMKAVELKTARATAQEAP